MREWLALKRSAAADISVKDKPGNAHGRFGRPKRRKTSRVWYVWCFMENSASNNGKIHKRVLIRASPGIVYHALTSAKDLAEWFCDRAVADPRIGGEIIAYWKTGKSGLKGRGVFTRLVPESLVEILWVDEGAGQHEGEAHHVLTYAIARKWGDTEVTMEDNDYPPPDDDDYEILDKGWNTVLLELKDHCEQKERSIKMRPEEE
jgi:uncharacterized protein YndB with AHSA1/START domain